MTLSSMRYTLFKVSWQTLVSNINKLKAKRAHLQHEIIIQDMMCVIPQFYHKCFCLKCISYRIEGAKLKRPRPASCGRSRPPGNYCVTQVICNVHGGKEVHRGKSI